MERLNPGAFLMILRESGTSLSERMENTFHFSGKTMSQFFPLKGKNFSLS
jgi:hypothetical protein